jgi:EpsI family protein
MTDNRPNRQSVIIAALVASFLMLVLGAGYRGVAGWLATPVNADPITQETLSQLPLQIGAWTGQDTPLPPEIIEATDTDAHVSRRYSKDNSVDTISLWIASGVQARDLMPHRPEVCYVGNGYTLVHQQNAELPLSSGVTLPCNVMEFARGTLNTEKVLVLYYYIVDGVYCQSVAQWRYQVLRRIGYVTQVQVVAPVTALRQSDRVREMVFDFTTESAAFIAELFEAAEKGPDLQ